jgi:putative FmdB family regulatory protein
VVQLPLYEYRCKQCGHQFEKIQTFSAPDEKECPVCKGELERLISAPAVQFKGSGWYVTDYAGKGSSKGPAKSAESGGSSDKPAAASSSDGGSSSAPASSTGPSSSTSSTKSE